MLGRSLLYRVTAITLIILLPDFLSAAGASARDGGVARPSEPVDGETLFTGLYFGRGPAAEYFPEIWQNPQVLQMLKNVDMNKSIDAQNRLMDLLREQDATIFTRFGVEMQSGDQIRVRDALREVGERIHQIALEETGNNSGRLGRDVRDQCVVVVVAVLAAVVAAIVVAGALWVYLYVDFWGPGLDKPKSAESSNLQRDLWIDTVTRRLAGTPAN